MMTKKREKCRGYITGKSIEQGFVPQQVQNIVVRNYCKNNDIEYLWSAVEFLMPNSYFHLENILSFKDSLTDIDFDEAGFGWHSCDLANALWEPELLSKPLYKIAYESIAEGYTEIRDDSGSVIENIELFILIRSLIILGWAEDRKELGYDTRIPSILDLALETAKEMNLL